MNLQNGIYVTVHGTIIQISDVEIYPGGFGSGLEFAICTVQDAPKKKHKRVYVSAKAAKSLRRLE